MEENSEMNKWTQKVYEHLGRYRATYLQKPYEVEFRGKLYRHILKRDEDGELNYINDDATNESKEIKRHMYWYHLNSSQTMCINYFTPFIKRDMLSAFFKIILGIEADIVEYKFEHTPKENSTNFDFWARGKNDDNYYFEIKYTEADVNKKTSVTDLAYAHEVFDRFYKEDYEANPLFKDHISFDKFMYEHYQAYRNMVKAKGKDYSIFITMDGNSGVTNELNKAIKDLKLIREKCPQNHILLLSWQEITEKTLAFAKELQDKELVEYFTKFKTKYIDLDK